MHVKDVEDAREMARAKGFERQFQILFLNGSSKTGVNKEALVNAAKTS